MFLLIAIEHDKLPPSISAVSKGKKGNFSDFFSVHFNQTRINCKIDETVNHSRKYFF